MKKLAVLTSGGDAPGMNAAIRAVVRNGIDKEFEIYGVQLGYQGLISDKIIPLGTRDVAGIIQRGGTILGSARCLEFKTLEGQKKALETLVHHQIDGLIVIGGNGSQAGANAMLQLGFPVVGIASTIDNDLYGSDITIGVDTALNIALEAIDRLKTTASSHQRAFLVEVMGRNCGYLALMSAIAGGAEMVVIPEIEIDPEDIAETIRLDYEKGKNHAIVVVAEGANYDAQKLMNYFEVHRERLGFELRATIIGHVQRGGSPGAYDRILASRLGAAAIGQFAKGETGVLVGTVSGQIIATPLSKVVANQKPLDLSLIELARVLD
jgi:6-phosphofructokinase 1